MFVKWHLKIYGSPGPEKEDIDIPGTLNNRFKLGVSIG